jgi:hypothetical protein
VSRTSELPPRAVGVFCMVMVCVGAAVIVPAALFRSWELRAAWLPEWSPFLMGGGGAVR